jgi:hypothetical protein
MYFLTLPFIYLHLCSLDLFISAFMTFRIVLTGASVNNESLFINTYTTLILSGILALAFLVVVARYVLYFLWNIRREKILVQG